MLPYSVEPVFRVHICIDRCGCSSWCDGFFTSLFVVSCMHMLPIDVGRRDRYLLWFSCWNTSCVALKILTDGGLKDQSCAPVRRIVREGSA